MPKQQIIESKKGFTINGVYQPLMSFISEEKGEQFERDTEHIMQMPGEQVRANKFLLNSIDLETSGAGIGMKDEDPYKLKRKRASLRTQQKIQYLKGHTGR
jgi:hypothetical protein